MKFILHRPEKGSKHDTLIEFALDAKTKEAQFYEGMSLSFNLYKTTLECAAAEIIELHGFELQANGSFKHREWFLRPAP